VIATAASLCPRRFRNGARPAPTIRVTERPASASSARSSASVRSPVSPRITSTRKSRWAAGPGAARPHQLADDEQPAALAHRGAARMKDLHCLCVVHPDHDVFEEVGVGRRPAGRPKSRRPRVRSGSRPLPPAPRAGLDDDVREVEQDAPQMRIFLEDARQQGPSSACHIDNHAESTEIISGEDIGQRARRVPGHRGIEMRVDLSVPGEVGVVSDPERCT
jgi:hypothetical protein